ncbi:MAG: hypothetical protein VR68_05805, partial [Peptococcaceae bacterium BRH_c4a]
RDRFLWILNKMKADGNYHIYAYCLMYNHVHLLMKEGKDSIQRTMKRIGVSYVYYFNSKYQRVGHLFQDRFRSEEVEEDSHVLAAARYIHNNPVKAGMVRRVNDYKWSSYTEYINKNGNREGLVEKSFLLSMLSDSKGRAIELFKEHTREKAIDEFIDCEETELKGINKEDLERIISNILRNSGQTLESIKECGDKSVRNRLIRELKETTGISVRELSRLLEISKDIVFRA